MYSINKLVDVAENEEGYLEKRSNADLDSKTGNAGSANFTKYWRDTVPSLQGSYWCADFISWLFMKAFGIDAAKKLLRHWPYISCQDGYERFRAAGKTSRTPERGRIVVFWNGSRMHHTGLVIAVTGTTFTTIEGNTSSGVSVVPNGGKVARKTYYTVDAQNSGHKFLIVDYGAQTKDCSKSIRAWQKLMNDRYPEILKVFCGAELEEDGEFGEKSKAAAIAVWKYIMNEKFNTKCSIKTEGFGSRCVKAADKALIKNGSKSPLVAVAKGILGGAGFYSRTNINNVFGDAMEEAVKDYQSSRGLTSDGIIGKNTWKSMLG